MSAGARNDSKNDAQPRGLRQPGGAPIPDIVPPADPRRRKWREFHAGPAHRAAAACARGEVHHRKSGRPRGFPWGLAPRTIALATLKLDPFALTVAIASEKQ